MNALFLRSSQKGIVHYLRGQEKKYTMLHYRGIATRSHKLFNNNTKLRCNLRHCYSTNLEQIPGALTSIDICQLDKSINSRKLLWPATKNCILIQHRAFHLTGKLLEQPSSKIESTVQAIKSKQKEKEDELKKEITQNLTQLNKISETPKELKIQKPLKTRIWEEIVHYYHGFRLLFIDFSISTKLIGRVLNGKKLTRRESRQLVRTTSDLFRLIPFSIFIIVPFMELLLPFFIKFFPGMLPSTFQTAKEREDKLKQNLKVKLEVAKFLQETLDEMSVQQKDSQSEEAKQFAEFFEKIKDPNTYMSSDEIIKFAKKFQDEITLDSLSREQLVGLCRVLELNTMGTTNFLRFQLRMKLRSLAADDRVIAREGVDALDLFELQQACKTRGMRAYGLSAISLREQLAEWIELSLNEKVPPTLLLLSRALQMSDDTTTTTEKLKETIRVLPQSLGEQTKAAIDEREGTIDNKTKIEVIKEEERKIREDREEARQEEKEEKQKAEILVDKAPTIESSGNEMLQTASSPAATEKEISSEDVELLGAALESVSKDKKKMLVEKETIKDLKEEIEDYKEDVEELREITTVKENIKVSRASKILFKKVNKMINQLDTVLNNLEKIGKKIQETSPHAVEDVSEKPEELVRIDDLVNAIKQMKSTSDESRLETIELVLSKIDADKDGHIKVDDVLKVIEAIGRDNVKLSAKQIEEVIDLLDKEEIIEAEEKIEKALAKSLKESNHKETIELQQLQQQIQDDPYYFDEMKDKAPVLKDNAKDLNETDKQNILKTESDAEKSKNETSRKEAGDLQKEKILPKTPVSIGTVIPPPTAPASKVKPKDKMV